MMRKRLILGILFGAISGFACYGGAIIFMGIEIKFLNSIYIILNRILIGFSIGISSVNLPWALHGVIIGFIVGLPLPLFDIIIGRPWLVVLTALLMNPLFGLLIELLMTKFFKLPKVKSI